MSQNDDFHRVWAFRFIYCLQGLFLYNHEICQKQRLSILVWEKDLKRNFSDKVRFILLNKILLISRSHCIWLLGLLFVLFFCFRFRYCFCFCLCYCFTWNISSRTASQHSLPESSYIVWSAMALWDSAFRNGKGSETKWMIVWVRSSRISKVAASGKDSPFSVKCSLFLQTWYARAYTERKKLGKPDLLLIRQLYET